MQARLWIVGLAAVGGPVASAAAGGVGPATDQSPSALAAAAALVGQPESQAAAPQSDRLIDRLSFRLRAGGTFSGDADLEDDGGTASVMRLATDFTVTARLDERSSLAFGAGAGFSFYDFDNATALVASGEEPIDDAASYDFSALYTANFENNWGIFAAGRVEFAPAGDASWSDSMMGSATGGATYSFSEDLQIGLGVSVSSRLEDDVRVIPIPTLSWQISEDWSLSTLTRAPDIRGLQLSWRATESLDAFLLAGWASREFRLDDESPVAEGVFRDERVPVMAGVTWRVTPQFTLNVAGGADAWTRYELLDSSGDEVADADADPTLTGWFGATIRF